MSRSAVGPIAGAVRRRFREGSARVAPADWRAWRRTVGIGAAAMVLLMVTLKTVAQRLEEAGAFVREPEFLLWLAEDGPFGFSSAVFFQTFGTDITLIFVIAAAAGIAAWCRRPITALSIPLAALGADLVGRLGWQLWARSRPDVLYEGIASPGFHSFPSGHTSKTVAVYGLLTFLWLRHSRHPGEWLVALVMLLFIVIVVPLGRLTMGVHWPSDIVGGLIIGICWLGILAWALRYERIPDSAHPAGPPPPRPRASA